MTLTPRGHHWESLGEDISIASLLAGLGDQTKRRKIVAGWLNTSSPSRTLLG